MWQTSKSTAMKITSDRPTNPVGCVPSTVTIAPIPGSRNPVVGRTILTIYGTMVAAADLTWIHLCWEGFRKSIWICPFPISFPVLLDHFKGNIGQRQMKILWDRIMLYNLPFLLSPGTTSVTLSPSSSSSGSRKETAVDRKERRSRRETILQLLATILGRLERKPSLIY